MGVSQRRERQKQELKAAILAAAREIAQQEGWQSVTIRKIAECVEYSPPAIYEYYESKEAILLALLHQGFSLLEAGLKKAYDSCSEPIERLLAMAQYYWDFAFEHPDLYQVMHGLAGVPFGAPEAPPAALASHTLVRDTLRTFMSTDSSPDGRNLTDLADTLWAALHGLLSLTVAGRLRGGKERSLVLMRVMVLDLLDAWRAGSSL